MAVDANVGVKNILCKNQKNKRGRIRIINEYPLPRFYHPNLLIH